MANTYKGFRDLECWKEARVLRQEVSKLVRKFPLEEKYLLVSQIIRSSRSVTANIAEGYGRYTYSDTRNFFIISRGSVTETLEHITVALDESYISQEIFDLLELQCEKAFRLINGYIAYLDRSKRTINPIPQGPSPIPNS